MDNIYADSKSWDEVDGALIQFFITDILYWLGMVELASPEEGKEIAAFRISGIGNRKSESSGQGTTPELPTPDIVLEE